MKLNVNGTERELDLDPDTPLLYALRDELALNSMKYGCGLGQCGACTVIADGEPLLSCIAPIMLLMGKRIVTLEGLGSIDNPGPMQQAFIEEQAAQCGYCIPGMMMRAQALLEKRPDAGEAEIRSHMQPNLCRCGTHMRILKAILKARDLMRGHQAHSPQTGASL